MTLPELAREVLDLLEGQRLYFAARRTKSPEECQNLLVESKEREKRLKAICRDIVDPPDADLFTGSES